MRERHRGRPGDQEGNIYGHNAAARATLWTQPSTGVEHRERDLLAAGRIEENAAFTRESLQKMGLKLFSKAASSTVTAACLPEGVDGEKLCEIMRDEKGIAMAGGQGDQMKGKVVRICHMGAITKQDIEAGLKVLGETLKEMKASSGSSCCCCK